MSHLASGDDETNASNARQRDLFAGLRKLFPGLPASLANAPGTFLGPDFFHDLVRPGVALYGGNPLTGKPNPMQGVVSLTAPVLQVRDVAAGDGVGYGATWKAERQSRIAIVGVGYADGLMRAMSWPAKVCIAGQMAPIVGRVSMDMITIDVTDMTPGHVHRGTKAELLGANIGVDDWAHWSGTLSYEILTSLGRRYAKVYSS
jgi:alanine racemase